MISAKKYRDEGEPHNTGGVHGEPDVFCLVEVGRNLPCFHSIDGAKENKDHVVDERHDERECGDAAGLNSAETEETLQCRDQALHPCQDGETNLFIRELRSCL